jgi:hypothetical protein
MRVVLRPIPASAARAVLAAVRPTRSSWPRDRSLHIVRGALAGHLLIRAGTLILCLTPS